MKNFVTNIIIELGNSGNKGNKGNKTLSLQFPQHPYTFIPTTTEGRPYGYHFKIYPRSQ